MVQCFQISALSLLTVLRVNLPTFLSNWREACSPHTHPMVGFNSATFLGLQSLGEGGHHDPTVHTCTTLWGWGVIGDTTSSSRKMLMRRLQYINCVHFSNHFTYQVVIYRLWESTIAALPVRKLPCGSDLRAVKSLWTFLWMDLWQGRVGE